MGSRAKASSLKVRGYFRWTIDMTKWPAAEDQHEHAVENNEIIDRAKQGDT